MNWKTYIHNHRLQAITLTVVLAFIVQLWVSYGLWEPSGRKFPLVPLITSWTFSLNTLGGQLLFYIFQGLLLTALLSSFRKVSIPLIFGIFLFWVLQDVLRIQAWAYQYMLFLALLWLAQIFPRQEKTQLYLMRFLLVATYLWTGFYKLNLHFVEEVYPWLMGIFSVTKPLAEIHGLGYGLAILEALLGLGLLWRRSRRYSCWVVTIFHLFILILLITDGWNYVVYAWNVFMVVTVWLLFGWPIESEKKAWWLRLRRWPVTYVMTFLVGIAPALYPSGLWPYDLSFTMYSGLSVEADLILEEPASSDEQPPLNCIPSKALKEAYPWKGKLVLSVDNWTISTMNVPSYPAIWYYKRVQHQLCDCLDRPLVIELIQKKPWGREDIKLKIPCE